MVTRLQQLYIGNHEEKLTAREHGFDLDFWVFLRVTARRSCIECT